MGLGLVGAMGVAGGQRALDEWLETRVAADLRREAKQQQEFNNLLRRQEHDQRVKHQDASLASLADERAANADLRRQTSADKLSQVLTPGDVVDPTQVDLLTGTGRGSLLEHQTAVLPSRQFQGALLTGPGGPTPTTGSLRTITNPGHPEQVTYRGTRSQREMQALLDRFPEGSRERAVLDYENATGRNAPSIFMPPPQREPTPHFQLQPIYDENGRPSGAIRVNTLTGEATPVEVGGNLRPPARGQVDDPQLPRGVSTYLMDLRSKYGSYDEALQELNRALPAIQQAHPRFDPVTGGNALRQLFSQPGGGSVFLGSGNILGGEPPSGGAPSASRRATLPDGSGAAGGTMTRDELKAVATRLGITEQAAADQAQARGIQVQ